MSSENIIAPTNPPPPAPPTQPPAAPKPTMPAAKPKPNLANNAIANNKPTNGSVSSSNGSPTDSRFRTLRLDGHVGFDSLPDQYVSHVIRDGFGFNILALGPTGVGKTTLLEALFNTKMPTDNITRSHGLCHVSVSNHLVELNEGNIKLKLSLGESKGFGDQIDKSESYNPIVEYVDSQFEKYLQEELKIHRSQSSLADTRIHCCLYIFSPIGHGLRALDLVTMKALHNKVNLIPIIGKSDTITKPELEKLRARITSELNVNGIEYYKFPVDDPEVADINSTNNALTPFAVVASNDFIRIGSKHIRARQYPWGAVHVENENHCDFVRLRDMVIRVNMEDLRDTTHSKHYELYRRVRLQQMGFGVDENGIDGFAADGHAHTFKETFESRRQAHLESLQRREEEMRAAFVQRVKEKEQELKENERELHNRFDRMKRDSADEKKRLEREKLLLDEEIVAFSSKKAAVLGSGTLMHGNASSGKLVDKSKKK